MATVLDPPLLLTDEEAIRAAAFNRKRARSGELVQDELPASLIAVVDPLEWNETPIETLAADPDLESDTLQDQMIAAQFIAWWQATVGFDTEDVDGAFGPYSEKVERERRIVLPDDEEFAQWAHVTRLKPRSPEAIDCLRAACRAIGESEEWAELEGTHFTMDEESDGYVSIPNYTFNDEAEYMALRPNKGRRMNHPANRVVWERIIADLMAGRFKGGKGESSATGLFQLLLRNVDRFMAVVGGRKRMGNALAQAIGGLVYIRGRYLNPTNAMKFRALPPWPGDKASRPKSCVYSYKALPEYGGPGYKPGEGY